MTDAEQIWKRFCQLVAIDAGIARDGPGGFEMLPLPGVKKQKGERYKHECFLGSIEKHRGLFMMAVRENETTVHTSTPES